MQRTAKDQSNVITVMLNPGIHCFQNSVDSDQQASMQYEIKLTLIE